MTGERVSHSGEWEGYDQLFKHAYRDIFTLAWRSSYTYSGGGLTRIIRDVMPVTHEDATIILERRPEAEIDLSVQGEVGAMRYGLFGTARFYDPSDPEKYMPGGTVYAFRTDGRVVMYGSHFDSLAEARSTSAASLDVETYEAAILASAPVLGLDELSQLSQEIAVLHRLG